MQGFFDLKTALDLRDKLRREFAKLRAAPLDVDAAFNFLVTAEHMPDWMEPPRPDLRKTVAVLRICSHIANGGKHFEVDSKRHNAVKSLERHDGFFDHPFFDSRFFDRTFFGGGELVVRLESDVANQLQQSLTVVHGAGDSVAVLNLADAIMRYWDAAF
jgi:hypothetical protein